MRWMVMYSVVCLDIAKDGYEISGKNAAFLGNWMKRWKTTVNWSDVPKLQFSSKNNSREKVAKKVTHGHVLFTRDMLFRWVHIHM